MNNMIYNDKKEISESIELNERDYLNLLLDMLKELSKNYAIAMSEASCDELYQKYKNMFDNYSNLQRKVYEIMFRNGWYVLEKADNNKIEQKYHSFSEEYDKLGQ